MNVRVTIPEKYKKNTDLVAISREEYEQFVKIQEELSDALQKIEHGEKEYKAGKATQIKSVNDLLEE